MFTSDKIKVKPNGEISTPDEVAFTLKCNKCGNEYVRVIDSHVYESGNYDPDSALITIKYLCTKCGNNFEYVV